MILYEEDIERLKKIQEYIYSNLDKDLSTKTIASNFFIEKHTLWRQFSQYFKISLQQFILNERMAEAYKLLLNKTMPICEVANIIGYKDKSTFSRAFSTYYSMPPKELIKKPPNK